MCVQHYTAISAPPYEEQSISKTWFYHKRTVLPVLLHLCLQLQFIYCISFDFEIKPSRPKVVCLSAILPAQEISRMLHLHLRSTEFLAAHCWQHGVMAFKMRPKHHYIWHVAMDVAKTRLNPRLHHVWSDEKFLGCIKKVACRCHGATVQKRAIERYLIALSTFLAKKA